ncbi:MAG: UDP-N-acetylmuramoylalanyl-D-glutamyl-2,6-diaminopimelate--D-alanyl-D-alanine ligase [Rhodospirillales bacterium]|nr:MAG: UDP-N-acetylmuramoylalanyl-D-glutamyl-2,6-diaminopimelate--D-alanyl-D-alanine ligase [Rhodospirillales bacterium]
MTGPRQAIWTAADAAAAAGGRSTGDWRADGVSIDSRTLQPGDLFVALAGPNFDGHRFVAEALAKGAAAAMVSLRPAGLSAEAPLLFVEDTMAGLNGLASAARRRTAATVIGVTGSVGKTGVKEALRIVLAVEGRTVASQGNLNNHWGLPLSLARLPAQATYAVLEMGMNHPGEITPLSRLARPDVAVITTVDAVHRANFASIEAIADAKAEIFAGLAPGGAAVLFRDNPQFGRLAAAAATLASARIVSFGSHPEADVRLVAADSGAGGSDVVAAVPGGTVSYRVPVAGAHWVTNSLCVLAAALAAGADVARVAPALADLAVPKGRGERLSIPLGGGVLAVIDDSYNASPVSMAASIAVLGGSQPGPSGRRIAVLGDMLELGAEAPALHAALVTPLRDHGIDCVFTAGPLMAHLHDALPTAMRGGHADSAEALAPQVLASVRGGDVVAVKGSAGSRMGVVVRALVASSGGAAPTAASFRAGEAG